MNKRALFLHTINIFFCIHEPVKEAVRSYNVINPPSWSQKQDICGFHFVTISKLKTFPPHNLTWTSFTSRAGRKDCWSGRCVTLGVHLLLSRRDFHTIYHGSTQANISTLLHPPRNVTPRFTSLSWREVHSPHTPKTLGPYFYIILYFTITISQGFI